MESSTSTSKKRKRAVEEIPAEKDTAQTRFVPIHDVKGSCDYSELVDDDDVEIFLLRCPGEMNLREALHGSRLSAADLYTQGPAGQVHMRFIGSRDAEASQLKVLIPGVKKGEEDEEGGEEEANSTRVQAYKTLPGKYRLRNYVALGDRKRIKGVLHVTPTGVASVSSESIFLGARADAKAAGVAGSVSVLPFLKRAPVPQRGNLDYSIKPIGGTAAAAATAAAYAATRRRHESGPLTGASTAAAAAATAAGTSHQGKSAGGSRARLPAAADAAEGGALQQQEENRKQKKEKSKKKKDRHGFE